MKKFDHTVKYKGEYYPAGAEVPISESEQIEINQQRETTRRQAKASKE